jgi:hypothetical protein
MKCFALNGVIYLIARGPTGIKVSKYDPKHNYWTECNDGPEWSDAMGWNNDFYYSTIQGLVAGPKIYLLARGPNGIVCSCFNTGTNTWSNKTEFHRFADYQGWALTQYFSTIKATLFKDCFYLMGRSPGGIVISKYDPENDSWTEMSEGPVYGDSHGWDNEMYYGTIKFVKV